ncbi:MAG: transporter substrate-binding domain-containing protein [Pseudomonas sp.]|uniref:substrate-binding periplasmic protein n=1 Tax=Pseudomonas sp. TaxID=306 RepID=UPI0033924542
MLWLGLVFAASAAELHLYTEESPPLNFLQDNRPHGLAVDLVEALAQRSGDTIRISLGPWTRGYQAAQSQADTAIFSTVRTAERETKFQWVGPILLGRTSFYSLKSAGLQIDSLAAAAQSGPLAVPKQWYTYETLAAHGFTNLYQVPGSRQMVTMLKHGRVKLIATDDVTLREELAMGGLTPEEVQVQLTFMRSAYYIAFSLQTSPAVVAQWQRQLDAMRGDGSFERIFRRWLPEAPLPPLPADLK